MHWLPLKTIHVATSSDLAEIIFFISILKNQLQNVIWFSSCYCIYEAPDYELCKNCVFFHGESFHAPKYSGIPLIPQFPHNKQDSRANSFLLGIPEVSIGDIHYSSTVSGDQAFARTCGQVLHFATINQMRLEHLQATRRWCSASVVQCTFIISSCLLEI